jgi:hypothetical protein
MVSESSSFERVRPANRGRRFHTWLAIAFLGTAFVAFAPTYYLKRFSGAPQASGLVHFHAFLFTGWLLLLFAQSALVALRRTDLHRRLGLLGAALATAMIPVGLLTAVAAARRGSSTPVLAPLELLIFPVGSILLFAAFVGAALWHRRRPDLHRRLMVLATASMMVAAMVRLPFVGQRPAIGIVMSLSFVVAGIVHDLRTRGRVHPVYVWGGLVILLSGPVRFGLSRTSAWRAVAVTLVR